MAVSDTACKIIKDSFFLHSLPTLGKHTAHINLAFLVLDEILLILIQKQKVRLQVQRSKLNNLKLEKGAQPPYFKGRAQYMHIQK